MKSVKFLIPTILTVFLILLFSKLSAQRKEKREIENFSEIEIKISADIIISQRDNVELTIEGKERDIDNIITEVKDDKLKIYKKKKIAINDNIKLYITTKDIRSIRSSGSSTINSEGTLSLNNLSVHSSGSGDINLNLYLKDLDIAMLGSGDIILKGKTDNQSIRISGSGDADLKDFESKTCNIKISGSADVDVYVKEHLDIYIFGSGDVNYRGSPIIGELKVSGSGNVRTIK